MIVALPFFSGDVPALRDLLQWIGQLGGAKKHAALLVADPATQWNDCMDLLSSALAVFCEARLITSDTAVTGWPAGSNALFLRAAQEASVTGQSFLWLEPDCIPLKPDWADSIQEAYALVGNPFMGRLYPSVTPGTPPMMMSGIGVYPRSTYGLAQQRINDREAWDVTLAPLIVNHATDTKLIQSFWGQPNLPPTFAATKSPGDPINTFTLDNIEPEAVLFHRNKNGTLIRLLRSRLLPNYQDKTFTVVMSFFHDDAVTAHQTLSWIRRLRTSPTHPILLSYEMGTRESIVSPIIKLAALSFSKVYQTQYRRPMRGACAASWAFIHAAMTMEQLDTPWLWMEPDAIPLKSNWLSVLQAEYDRCGKPFCGPVVPFRGHMNGTGIYPANTPSLIPKTMISPQAVFDYEMCQEMIHLCHDCSRIFCHVWGLQDGKFNPVEGEAPSFRNRDLLKQIPPEAVILHRSKDGTLIEALSEQL